MYWTRGQHIVRRGVIYNSQNRQGGNMATAKQRTAARRNIKKATSAAKQTRTIAHLSKRTRTALGKQGAKTARQNRRAA